MNIFKNYRLKTNPFTDNIDTSFFYKTQSHEEAFIHLIMCVEHGLSLGLLTAKSGMGKSLMAQYILEQVGVYPVKSVLVLATPHMSQLSFLKELCLELECAPKEDIMKARSFDLINMIQETAISLYEEGLRLLILVDEAHFLKPSALHTLRTLTNIEVPTKKLVTCLLFAEPSFMRRIQHPSYASLRTRMYVNATLKPFSNIDTEQYIKFRCLMAGGDGQFFEHGIFDIIHKKTGGICREINKLCYNILLLSSIRKRTSTTIDEQFVRNEVLNNDTALVT